MWLQDFLPQSMADTGALIPIFLHQPYAFHYLLYHGTHLLQPRGTVIEIRPPGSNSGEPPLAILECRLLYERDLKELKDRFPVLEGPDGARFREISEAQFDEMMILAQYVLRERIGVYARWQNVNNHFNPDGTLKDVVDTTGPLLQGQVADPAFIQHILDMPIPDHAQAPSAPVSGTASHEQFLPPHQSPYPPGDVGVPSSSIASGPPFAAQAQPAPGHLYAPGPPQAPPYHTGYLGVPPPAASQAQFAPGHQYAPGPPQFAQFPPYYTGYVGGPPPVHPQAQLPQAHHYAGAPRSILPAESQSGGLPNSTAASGHLAAPPPSVKKRRTKRPAAPQSVDALANNSSDGNRPAKRNKTWYEQELEGYTAPTSNLMREIAGAGNGTGAARMEDTEMKDGDKGNENGGDSAEQS
jgi:hypothetical protein